MRVFFTAAILVVLPFLGGCYHRYGYLVHEERCPPPARCEPGHVHGPNCGHLLVEGCWLEWDQEFVDHAWWYRGSRVPLAPPPILVPVWGGWRWPHGPGILVPDFHHGR